MVVELGSLNTDTLQEYEQLFIAYFEALYPTFNWSTGSFLYEMVIRPQAILAASQEQDLETLRDNLSLSLASQQASPDEELVGNLASNFRLSATTGSPGSGELAVYTSQTLNVYIRSGAVFTFGDLSVTTTKTYIGVLDTSVYENSADTEYRELVQVGDEYVFLVPVQTATNTSASLSEGTVVQMMNKPTQVSRVVVASAVSGGADNETTSGLVEKAESGVTARIPSGNTHLATLLAAESGVNILSQKSFGIRDPECLRDRNNIFGISMGGRVDAYCRTSQLPATYQVTKTATRVSGNTWTVDLNASECRGFYYIEKITNSSVAEEVTNQDEITMSFRYEAPPAGGPEVFSDVTARYSSYQAVTLTFTFPIITSDTASFTFYLRAMPNLATLQAFVNRPDVRNEAQDVLIKAPVPCFIGVSLTVLKPAGNTSTTASQVQAAIASAINALAIGDGFVSASTVVQAVEALSADLETDFPVVFDSSTYLPDGTRHMMRSCTGKISAYEDEDQGVTARNTVFFCLTGDVNITLQDST